MRIARLISPALVGLAVCAPLGAQAPAIDPLYHVEIIVFAHLSADRGEEDFRHGRESLLPAPAPRLYEFPALDLEALPAFITAAPGFGGGNTVTSGTPDPGPAAGPGAAPDATPPPRTDGLELIELAEDRARAAGRFVENAPLPGDFRILRADELALTAEAARLARAAGYRVLGHAGWAQTGVDTDRSVALDLKYLGITNPAGTVEFYLGRFRHVEVDMTYFDGGATFWSAPGEPGLAPLVYAESYRLQAVENDVRELRYIDHPLFGMLILIRPAPEPTSPGGANPAGGPAA
jgi:hypothetical protein